MITETGKAIISKYLIGQSPGYASHIALGCGPRPLSSGDSFGNYAEKESLDFEMFRVPIISRGYVTVNNQTSIALTAELPTEERYEITEVGIYSAASNPSAGSRDSKTVFSFARNEGWEYHAEGSAQSLSNQNQIGSTDIDFHLSLPPTLTDEYRYYVLAAGLTANTFRISKDLLNPDETVSTTAVSTAGLVQNGSHTVLNTSGTLIGTATISIASPATITLTGHGLSAQSPVYFSSNGQLPSSILSSRPVVPAFQTSSSNSLFNTVGRVERNERSRFLDNTVLVAGDTGNILKNATTGQLTEGAGSRHIHLTGQSFSFDQNSSTDELRFAFSIVNRLENFSDPTEVRAIIEFRSTEGDDENAQFARFSTNIMFPVPVGGVRTNRYLVRSLKLEDLEKSANFTWSAMTVAKISVSILELVGTQLVQSDKWYMALDALRFENTSIKSPLYGLTGYSVVRTANGQPIIKGSNTKNLVEFRFALSLGS